MKPSQQTSSHPPDQYSAPIDVFSELIVPPTELKVPGFTPASLHANPRVLFIDMNAFYASVEQQMRPELRGHPVAVRLSDGNVVIAASYDAKAFGVKTRMPIAEAIKLCPDLAIVASRPRLYIDVHFEIFERLKCHFERVTRYSIDEMAAHLDSQQQNSATLVNLANRVKEDIKTSIGQCLRCSIGIGPNVFSAKIAADMKKPDGLTILDGCYLQLFSTLPITELPGIGSRQATRLARSNITSITDLISCSKRELKQAWGSIEGAHFYERLRGSLDYDYLPPSSNRRSITSSRALPEQYQNVEGVKTMGLVLASKAMIRLRSLGLFADSVDIGVLLSDKHSNYYKWRARSSLRYHAHDDPTWYKEIRMALREFSTRHGTRPVGMSISFSGLSNTPDSSLYGAADQKLSQLSEVVDEINARQHGSIHFGAMFFHRRAAPLRIPFGPPDPPRRPDRIKYP